MWRFRREARFVHSGPRRMPLSGSPKIDHIFTTIWMGLGTLTLWAFLYAMTVVVGLVGGPVITAIVFGGLLFLFLVAIAEMTRRT